VAGGAWWNSVDAVGDTQGGVVLARMVTSCLDLAAAAATAAKYTGWAMAEAGLEEQASVLMTNAGVR